MQGGLAHLASSSGAQACSGRPRGGSGSLPAGACGGGTSPPAAAAWPSSAVSSAYTASLAASDGLSPALPHPSMQLDQAQECSPEGPSVPDGRCLSSARVASLAACYCGPACRRIRHCLHGYLDLAAVGLARAVPA